jgi:aspartyl-tRNA(Asn)/glutamyl-tRNA(Gln) amidotransferase subunit A
VQAGAVLVGKTTTPEFGWKGDRQPALRHHPQPLGHAADRRRSSGGAAAAAALNLGVAPGQRCRRLDPDPCAFTGTFGIKPTFGYVPQWPASAMTVLSHLGPMTRTVDDAVLMLTASPAPMPATVWPGRHGNAMAGWRADLSGLHRLQRRLLREVDPQVQALVAQAVQRLARWVRRLRKSTWFQRPAGNLQHLVVCRRGRLTSSFSDEQRGLLDPGLRWIAEQGARISLSEYTQALEARAELIAR